MYAVSILGADAPRAVSRLATAADGRVGTVRLETTEFDGGLVHRRQSSVETEYVVDDGWRASGSDLSISDALDRLAPDHKYAFVLGAPDARLPTISIGDGHEDALVSVPDVDALDPSAAIEKIDGTEPYETLESLVASVKRSDAAVYSGAIATFTGRVRAKEHENDERTRYLEFEKYEGVAEERMRTIEAELEAREGVLDVRLHHRTGRIPDGEDIVFVVVLAGHRDEAFTAVEDGINRLKDEVPLFKKEVTDEETFWVHERE